MSSVILQATNVPIIWNVPMLHRSTLHAIVHSKYLFYHYNALRAHSKKKAKRTGSTKELYTMGNSSSSSRQPQQLKKRNKVEYLQRSSPPCSRRLCAVWIRYSFEQCICANAVVLRWLTKHQHQLQFICTSLFAIAFTYKRRPISTYWSYYISLLCIICYIFAVAVAVV